MVIMQVNPADTPELIRQEAQKALIEKFNKSRERLQASMSSSDNNDGHATGVDVTSIIWQESSSSHNGMSETDPYTVIFGPGYVHEEILGLR